VVVSIALLTDRSGQKGRNNISTIASQLPFQKATAMISPVNMAVWNAFANGPVDTV